MEEHLKILRELPKELLEHKRVKREKNIDLDVPVREKWTKCKGYIRCSTEVQLSNSNENKKNKTEKNHYSLEIQEDLIKKKAAELGLPLVRIYRDEAVSGAKDDRDALKELVRDMRRGEILIVTWITRLSRSMKHFVNTLDDIHTRGIRLISIKDDIDTSKPGIEQMLHFKAMFGSQERKILRQRIRDAMTFKRERGEHIGRVPYGKLMNDQGKLEPDLTKKVVLDSIVHLRSSGVTYQGVADAMNILASTRKEYELSSDRKWTERLTRSICIREMGKSVAKRAGKFKRTVRTAADSDSESEESENEHSEGEESGEGERDETPEDLPGFSSKTLPQTPTLSPTFDKSDLQSKSLMILRVMVSKRKVEFNLTDEDIRSCSKDDLIDILSM
jgi:DNA invertase Pin-like site-specific DNA recombinase